MSALPSENTGFEFCWDKAIVLEFIVFVSARTNVDDHHFSPSSLRFALNMN
jgi:hypothetical protein